MSPTATLTRKQLRELEAELRLEHARLERRVKAASAAEAGTGESASGADVRYSAGSPDGAIGVMLGTRTELRYEAVAAALTRLEAGSYGVCVTCEKPIPYGRLLVMPEAAHCVRCGVHA